MYKKQLFQRNKIREKNDMFYIFASLLNVWLNRRQLGSHIFCIQIYCDIVSVEVYGKNPSHRVLEIWKRMSILIVFSDNCGSFLGCYTQSWPVIVSYRCVSLWNLKPVNELFVLGYVRISWSVLQSKWSFDPCLIL